MLNLDLDHFRLRVLAQAFTEAQSRHWEQRAQVMESCRPRPEDYTGRADAAELAALDRRCLEAAQLCRHLAQLIAETPPTQQRESLTRFLDELDQLNGPNLWGGGH